jgi:hypothetical protein
MLSSPVFLIVPDSNSEEYFMRSKFVPMLGFGLAVALTPAFGASIPVVSGGNSVVPGGNNSLPVSATVVASFTGSGANANNPAVIASVTEYVVKDNTTGFYDFLYEVSNNSTNGDTFNTVGVDNYTPVCASCTSVANNMATVNGTAPGTVAATLSARDAGGGDTVNFQFANNIFTAGSTTQWLEVDTNAVNYTTVRAFTETIDGGVIQINGGYGPAPEPATLGLLGGGLALLGVARLRRTKRA